MSTDERYKDAVDLVRLNDKTNISFVQRSLRIGYNRAVRLIEAMENDGIVTAMDKHGKRKVLAAI